MASAQNTLNPHVQKITPNEQRAEGDLRMREATPPLKYKRWPFEETPGGVRGHTSGS